MHQIPIECAIFVSVVHFHSYVIFRCVFFDRSLQLRFQSNFHVQNERFICIKCAYANICLCLLLLFFFSLSFFFSSFVSITLIFPLRSKVCNCFESSASYNKFIALLSSHCFDFRSAWNTIRESHVGLRFARLPLYACVAFANETK